ncbi:uncharacterized protein LOC121506052 [Cheilinus undulatus]|uniref:uncharacterized protein LOC121506052 n=1 Tax=Cheilinus undulatus TaxID=241271 RepID=UPI001BD6B14C|nr:uncharacterized protein LOC121506052 [Cheilinus undulatus]
METDTFDESRTVVVSGVPKVLPVSRMIDKLTIHFQRRRRSHGGDVDVVRYPTNMDGVAFVTFDSPEDAARVVRKEEQIMMDSEFPSEYPLTVFPFTRDVYFYASRAEVDLSMFGSDQESLIQSLRSTHRSLRFLPLPKQRKATIEGPFSAVQALRKDLIHRANQLKSTDSAQTAPTRTPETPLNPRVISHRESFDSVSRGGSKAKPEPANSLSTGLQTTGEVQSLLLNAKTQNDSSRQKVQERGSAEGSFLDTNYDEVGAQSRTRVKMSAESKNKQMLEEGNSKGITSSLSGYDLPHAAEISAKEKQQEDDILHNHNRRDRRKKTQKVNHLDSHFNNINNQEESEQSDLATAAKLTQITNKNVSNTSEDPEETCIWVDSNTFRYIEKFDKTMLDECLRGLDVSVDYVKGSDLVKVILTEKQTSEVTSGIQQALEDLQALVESRVTTLRVHEIAYEEEEEQEVIQICKDVNFLVDEVLYMCEGSSVRVIGPSVDSHTFYSIAKRRISLLEHKPMDML